MLWNIRGDNMDFLNIAPPIVWGTLVLFLGFFVLYKFGEYWDKQDMQYKKGDGSPPFQSKQ
jgi:hypothetical protein